jgi:putative tryptophan/tyrosine transport system substrate-binding protein
MARGDRRKCRCCRKLFRPDPRNRRHQRYCSMPRCRAARKTRPIVFLTGADSVATGLVGSFSRPGGNLTGVSALIGGAIRKRLEILHEFVPSAVTIASLVNPDNLNAQVYARETQAAADALGLRITSVEARREGDLEAAFTIMVQRQAGALVVMADPSFIARREQIVASTNRCAMPAIYPVRVFPDVGRLMSYGASSLDLDRQMGIYTGKILKGAKAGDIPI